MAMSHDETASQDNTEAVSQDKAAFKDEAPSHSALKLEIHKW